jgi:hypothetical protein
MLVGGSAARRPDLAAQLSHWVDMSETSGAGLRWSSTDSDRSWGGFDPSGASSEAKSNESALSCSSRKTTARGHLTTRSSHPATSRSHPNTGMSHSTTGTSHYDAGTSYSTTETSHFTTWMSHSTTWRSHPTDDSNQQR